MKTIVAALLFSSLLAVAQTTLIVPQDAASLPASEFSQQISGKVYKTVFANGNPVRLQIDTGGYYFLNVARFKQSGKWRTEDGKLCFTDKVNVGEYCGESRFTGNDFYFKRENGEMVKYTEER